TTSRVGIGHRLSARIVWYIEPRRICANQRCIVALRQSYRQAGGKARNAGESPSASHSLYPSRASPFFKRQHPVVADDKAMGEVEVAKGNAAPRIERIGGILESRGIVHALAVGVGRAKRQ